MTEMDAIGPCGGAGGTLVTLAESWIAGRVARGEITEESARTKLVQLRSLTGRCPDVAGLDRAVLLEWQEAVGGKAPATRKAYLCTVQGFCRWLVEEGHLERDPAARLARPRLPRQAPRALPPDDVAAIIQACQDARERAIVWLEVGCGLRACEVANLDLADWDRLRGQVFVSGKSGHQRYVPVPEPVTAALDGYLDDRGTGAGPLIRATDRNRQARDARVSASRVSKIAAEIISRAGVKGGAGDGKSGHAFRHTFATDVLAATNDLRAVQELLGHANIATTNRYLGAAGQDRLRAAVEMRWYGQRADEAAGMVERVEKAHPARQLASADCECTIHCPLCCTDGSADACEADDCRAWVDVPASTLMLVRRPDTPAGWAFTAISPQCGHQTGGALTPQDLESLIALLQQRQSPPASGTGHVWLN